MWFKFDSLVVWWSRKLLNSRASLDRLVVPRSKWLKVCHGPSLPVGQARASRPWMGRPMVNQTGTWNGRTQAGLPQTSLWAWLVSPRAGRSGVLVVGWSRSECVIFQVRSINLYSWSWLVWFDLTHKFLFFGFLFLTHANLYSLYYNEEIWKILLLFLPNSTLNTLR